MKCDNCGTEIKGTSYDVMRRRKMSEKLQNFLHENPWIHEYEATVCSKSCGGQYLSENGMDGKVERA